MIRRINSVDDIEFRRKAENLSKQVGPRHWNCSFRNYETDLHDGQKDVVERVQNLVPAIDRESLILGGPVGVGKDHLAVAVIKRLLQRYRERSFRWVTGHAIAKSTKRELKQFLTCDYLGVSDPAYSKAYPKNFGEIVRARYDLRLPIIATINVDSHESGEWLFKPDIWGRLVDDAYVVWMDWPSYRTPKKEVFP